MKILKLPVDMKITCYCGCEFEFDADDVEQTGYEMLDGTEKYSRVVVDCPFCKYRHVIQETTITRPEINTEVNNE